MGEEEHQEKESNFRISLLRGLSAYPEPVVELFIGVHSVRFGDGAKNLDTLLDFALRGQKTEWKGS